VDEPEEPLKVSWPPSEDWALKRAEDEEGCDITAGVPGPDLLSGEVKSTVERALDAARRRDARLYNAPKASPFDMENRLRAANNRIKELLKEMEEDDRNAEFVRDRHRQALKPLADAWRIDTGQSNLMYPDLWTLVPWVLKKAGMGERIPKDYPRQ